MMFSVQTEARMRCLAGQLEHLNMMEAAKMFEDTANSCRLVRLYLTAFLGAGISVTERLECLSYIVLSLRSLYNPFSFPPGNHQHEH